MMTDQNAEINPNAIAQVKVLALLGAVLLVGSNSFVLSPILSEVAAGLSTQTYHVAWAISAFGAATALSALTLAGMIDRMSVGRVLGGAALLLAVAQVSSGLSQHWVWLCLSQALAGVAVGVLLPGSYATVTATAPKGREAARLGVVLTGWALSLVVAVPAAAFITEQFGWRMVYFLMAGLSVLVAGILVILLSDVRGGMSTRTSPLRAFRLPGVWQLLAVMLVYMTAFYGCFAFFGVGVRTAFDLSAQGSGMFVMAYGVGFGVMGFVLGVISPKITRGYLCLVLIAIATSYATWGLTLQSQSSAMAGTAIWGMLNQLGLNAMVVSLNRQASDARGAVMGLNSAVTYSAVFAGPMIMGPIYAGFGFAAVAGFGAVLVMCGVIVSWRRA
ncbi:MULTISPECIES: MFS transporter [Thalassospira]|uniref:Transporter protein n=1 Tax=Thalassospira profundimaris TaxID=502049 RepID=A0A367VAW1_9PROT|nr:MULTISPECIES: MFS transporter [Thalassospira]KZB71906.1 transporter protein [Thalassospira sp. MCCC 1A01148]MBR9901427.1 MFS transporter [Rhodospirillales bacterium]RCK22337.1 transporter protein [Thalassospira profundimaris]